MKNSHPHQNMGEKNPTKYICICSLISKRKENPISEQFTHHENCGNSVCSKMKYLFLFVTPVCSQHTPRNKRKRKRFLIQKWL